MVNSLDKQWKVVLFSFAGFGPNLLMIIMGAYFTDAINPAAMGTNSLQVINGTCLILPAIFPILWMLAKAFDGLVDIPLAALTDSLSTKWGKRRPTILIGLIPMILSYIMCWIPVGDQTFYTIWLSIWALIFFTSYTLCMISYYGSFTSVCASDRDKSKLSSYKSFFDTISYCVTYALVPLLLSAFNVHIDKFVLYLSPIFLTMLIPLFLIKEGEKYGYPEKHGLKEERVSIVRSLKVTFGNKLFRRWLVVNSCSFFGLQMFLVAMNAMIIGGMGFESWEMAIVNTAAFAPVPIMLYLFNKLRVKKGLRLGLQLCLVAFAVAILSFVFSSLYVTGGNRPVQYTISIIGGICSSWSIGTFFMLPYIIPVQIASVEEKVTGVNHSAMYFAAQAVTTSVVGAIAGGVVYENIKMLFIDKPSGTVVTALNHAEAASAIGVPVEQIHNLGTLIVPIVVSIMCIVGLIVSFKLPKDFSSAVVAKEFKKFNPDIDISNVKDEKLEDKDYAMVNVALWLLSMGIFGFIWTAFAISKMNKITGRKHTALKWILCTVIPFGGAVYMMRMYKHLSKEAEAKNIKLHSKAFYVISGILLPIMPMNPIGLSLMTADTGKFVD